MSGHIQSVTENRTGLARSFAFDELKSRAYALGLKIKALAVNILYGIALFHGITFHAHVFAFGVFMGAVYPAPLHKSIAQIQKLLERCFYETIVLGIALGYISFPLPLFLGSYLAGHHLGEKFKTWCKNA